MSYEVIFKKKYHHTKSVLTLNSRNKTQVYTPKAQIHLEAMKIFKYHNKANVRLTLQADEVNLFNWQLTDGGQSCGNDQGIVSVLFGQ